MKVLSLSAVALIAFSTAAAAGESRHARSDGFQLHIKCVRAGCTVRGQKPGGNWGLVEKGPGGNKNYRALVAKYKSKGFK